MKGIVLAGGTGTRLFPVTQAVSKQLLPVYDKPLIYYPISTLMLAGVRDILVITRPIDRPQFEMLLGDGTQWGLSISYAEQETPRGIVDALHIGRDFLRGEPCALVLGDNLFYGAGLSPVLKSAARRTEGATVFGYWVGDPERYGVLEFDAAGQVVGVEEKPQDPKSNFVLTGLYFFDGQASKLAETIAPSARGELEITDMIRLYLEAGALKLEYLGRGYAWLDTGTHRSLLQASQFVQTIEERQSLKIGCPEEIAFRSGFISREQVLKIADTYGPSSYADYLRLIVRSHR